jgi:hypothetical protein
MVYATVTVLVDGALEQEDTFFDETAMRAWIDGVGQDAVADGYPTEVYIVEHAHAWDDTDDECTCAQYLTDHHPAYQWNTR